MLAVGLLNEIASAGGVEIHERNAGGPNAWGEVWSSGGPPLPFPWTFDCKFGWAVDLDGEHLFVSDTMENFGLSPSGPGVVFAFQASAGGS